MSKQFFSLLLIFSLFGIAQTTHSQSSIKFRIKNAGFTVYGTFEEFDLDVVYKPSDLGNSHFNGTVNVRSINTSNKARDKHLRNEDFFHANKWPLMTFRSSSVKKIGANKIKVTGKLSTHLKLVLYKLKSEKLIFKS